MFSYMLQIGNQLVESFRKCAWTRRWIIWNRFATWGTVNSEVTSYPSMQKHNKRAWTTLDVLAFRNSVESSSTSKDHSLLVMILQP